jgi:hypothetical protein
VAVVPRPLFRVADISLVGQSLTNVIDPATVSIGLADDQHPREADR